MKSRIVKVAAIQTQTTSDLASNWASAEIFFRASVEAGAQIIAFPENFLLMSQDRTQLLREAFTPTSVGIRVLQNWALSAGVWLLAGSVNFKIPGKKTKLTNSSLLIDPKGKIRARYDKIHLFDAALTQDRKYRESDQIQSGKKPILLNSPIGKMGLSICYDLRFSELYRRYAQQKVEIIFIPSAFTALTGAAHWDPLTRARAIENQAFVIAPAQTGSPYPGRQTYGHSRIIDPWGVVLVESEKKTGPVFAQLDFDQLRRIRKELPALEHRKLR